MTDRGSKSSSKQRRQSAHDLLACYSADKRGDLDTARTSISVKQNDQSKSYKDVIVVEGDAPVAKMTEQAEESCHDRPIEDV